MNSVVVPKHPLKVNARKSCSKPLYKHGELIGSGFSTDLKPSLYYSCRLPSNIQKQLVLSNGVYKENVQKTEHTYWNHHDFKPRILQNLDKQMENSDIDVENVAAIYEEKPELCSKLKTLQNTKDLTTDSLKWCHNGKNQNYLSSAYKNICRRNANDQCKTAGDPFSETKNQHFSVNSVAEHEFTYNRTTDALRPVYSNNYSQNSNVASDNSKYMNYKSKPPSNEGMTQKVKSTLRSHMSGKKTNCSETDKRKKVIYSNKYPNSKQNTRNFILHMKNSALKGVLSGSKLHPKTHFSKRPRKKTKQHYKANLSTNKPLNSVHSLGIQSKSILMQMDKSFIFAKHSFKDTKTSEIKSEKCDQSERGLSIPVLQSVSEDSSSLEHTKTEDSGYKLILSDSESEASVKTVKQGMPPLLIPLSPATEEMDSIEILPASPQMPTLIPFTSENEIPPFTEGNSSNEPSQTQALDQESFQNSFKSNKRIQSQFWYEKFVSGELLKENNRNKLPPTYYPWMNFANASSKIPFTKRSKQIFPHLTKYFSESSPTNFTNLSVLDTEKNYLMEDYKLNGSLQPVVVLERLKDFKISSFSNNWQSSHATIDNIKTLMECDGAVNDGPSNKAEIFDVKFEKDPEVDLIDGQEFFSFLSETDMDIFSEKHGHSFSFYSELSNLDEFDYFEAQLLQEHKDKGIIVPRKTNDITLIKGWRNKLFFESTLPTVKQEILEANILSSFNSPTKFNNSGNAQQHDGQNTAVKTEAVKNSIKSDRDVHIKINDSGQMAEKNKQLEIYEETAKRKNTRSAFVSDVLDSFLNHSELRVNLLEKYNPNVTPLPKNSPVLSIETLKTKERSIWNSRNYLKSHQKLLDNFSSEFQGKGYFVQNDSDLEIHPEFNHSSPLEEKSLDTLHSAKRKVNNSSVLSSKKHKYEYPKSPDLTPERLVLKLKKEPASGENEAYKVTNIYSCRSPIEHNEFEGLSPSELKKKIKISLKNQSPLPQNSTNTKKLKKEILIPIEEDSKSSIIRELCSSLPDIEERLKEFFEEWKKETIHKLKRLNSVCSNKKFICPVISEKNAQAIASNISLSLEVVNKSMPSDLKDSNSEFYEYELFADDYSCTDPCFSSSFSEENAEKHPRQLDKVLEDSTDENICDTGSDQGNSLGNRTKRSIRLPARYMDSAVLVAGTEWVSPDISPKSSNSKKLKRKLENPECNANSSNVSISRDDNNFENKALKKELGLLDESYDGHEDQPFIIDEDEYNNYNLFHSEESEDSPKENSPDKKICNKLNLQNSSENLGTFKNTKPKSIKEKQSEIATSVTKTSPLLGHQSPLNFDDLSMDSSSLAHVQYKPTIVPIKPSVDNTISSGAKSKFSDSSYKNILSNPSFGIDSVCSMLDKAGETITLYSSNDDHLNRNASVLSLEKDMKDTEKSLITKSSQLSLDNIKEDCIKPETSENQISVEENKEMEGSSKPTKPFVFSVYVGDKLMPVMVVPSLPTKFESKMEPETDVKNLDIKSSRPSMLSASLTSNENGSENRCHNSNHSLTKNYENSKLSSFGGLTVRNILKQVKGIDSNLKNIENEVCSTSKFNGTTSRFILSKESTDDLEKSSHQLSALTSQSVDKRPNKPYIVSVNRNNKPLENHLSHSPNHYEPSYTYKPLKHSKYHDFNMESAVHSEKLEDEFPSFSVQSPSITEDHSKKYLHLLSPNDSSSSNLCPRLTKPSHVLESIDGTSTSQQSFKKEVNPSNDSFEHKNYSIQSNKPFIAKNFDLKNNSTLFLDSSSLSNKNQLEGSSSEQSLNSSNIQPILLNKTMNNVLDSLNSSKWTHFSDIGRFKKIVKRPSPKSDECDYMSASVSSDNLPDTDFIPKIHYTTSYSKKKFSSLHELATQFPSEKHDNRRIKHKSYENGYASGENNNDSIASECKNNMDKETGDSSRNKETLRVKADEERQKRRIHQKLLCNLLKVTTKSSKQNISEEAVLKTAIKDIHSMESMSNHLESVVDRLVSYRKLLLNRYKQLVEDLPNETKKKNIFDLVKKVKRAQMRSSETSENKSDPDEIRNDKTSYEDNVCASSKVPKSSSASSLLNNVKLPSDVDKKQVAAAACKIFGPCVVRRVRLKDGRIAYAYRPVPSAVDEPSLNSDNSDSVESKVYTNLETEPPHVAIRANNGKPHISQSNQITSEYHKSNVHSDSSLARTDDLKDPPKLFCSSTLDTPKLCSSPVKMQTEMDTPVVNNCFSVENTSVWVSNTGEPCYVTQLSPGESTEDEQILSSPIKQQSTEMPTIISCSTISEEEFLRPLEERNANSIAG